MDVEIVVYPKMKYYASRTKTFEIHLRLLSSLLPNPSHCNHLQSEPEDTKGVSLSLDKRNKGCHLKNQLLIKC